MANWTAIRTTRKSIGRKKTISTAEAPRSSRRRVHRMRLLAPVEVDAVGATLDLRHQDGTDRDADADHETGDDDPLDSGRATLAARLGQVAGEDDAEVLVELGHGDVSSGLNDW